MERSRRYSAETITDVGYADYLALLANTTTQAKSRFDSQGERAGGICLHVNANETARFKRINPMFSKRRHLKFEDNYTYLGSRISSPESDVNKDLAKV